MLICIVIYTTKPMWWATPVGQTDEKDPGLHHMTPPQVERGTMWLKDLLFHTIKDTWTKSRGRVEVGEGGGFSWGGVEGWGEKAHNCNWITIKFFLKKICCSRGWRKELPHPWLWKEWNKDFLGEDSLDHASKIEWMGKGEAGVRPDCAGKVACPVY